jgi:subtilisin family serine protease
VKEGACPYGEGLDFVATGCDIIQETYIDWEEDEDGNWSLVPSQTTPKFTALSGTSMATPHVSGLAALLIAQGIKEPDDVKKALQESAYDLGDAEQYGYELVNGVETIKICSQPLSEQYLLMLYQFSSVEDKKRDGLPEAPWDINLDDVVNIFDLVIVASQFSQGGANLSGDVNGDGVINIFDLVLVGSHFGEGKADAPTISHIVKRSR